MGFNSGKFKFGHQVYIPRPAASFRILQVFVTSRFLTMILILTLQVYSILLTRERLSHHAYWEL